MSLDYGLISDIHQHWLSRNWNFDIKFIDPILIHTTKWKFYYVIFKKTSKMFNVF